jgi:hypothetical protein
LEEKLKSYSNPVTIEGFCVRHSGRVTLRQFLSCDICIRTNCDTICKNRNISGQTLIRLKPYIDHSNPKIWDEIKDDIKLLEQLSGDDYYDLLQNPCSMSYLETIIVDDIDDDVNVLKGKLYIPKIIRMNYFIAICLSTGWIF